MPRTEKYFIGPGLLSDIRQTITRVAGMPDKTKGPGFRVGSTEMPQRAGGKVFRVCTFTGSWSINATKTVTFRGVTTTPNTVAAINLVCGLNPGTVTCDVSVAKDGTAWYLVQPNLTKQPGYSGSGTQVLTIQNGSLAWVGTTAC